MEQQITWLILTVVLNGLVTGIIVVWFGKRLESRLGRQNFEYQTKFTQVHAKRIETLEYLYLKFVKAAKKFSSLMVEAFEAYNTIYELEVSKHRDVELEIDDAGKYFLNNRLFLDAKTITEIEGVFDRQTLFRFLIKYIEAYAKSPSPEQVEHIRYFITQLHLDENMDMEKELETGDLVAVVFNFAGIMANDVERLEHLYKSVADTTDK